MTKKLYKVRYKKKLPQRIQYPGSTIQQNFGEDLEKGYLLWDINGPNDFDVNFHKVENNYGFYTIYVDDGVLPDLNLPPKCRIRVVWPIAESDISRSLVNELTKLVYAKYNPLSVRIDFKPIKDKKGKSLDIDGIIDVREFSVQQDLLKRWLVSQKLPEKKINEILSIDKKIFEKVNDLQFEDFTDSLWKINKIKITNFMSYAGPEVIDFKKFRGIVGLFGDNRSGKSVIIDAILYALFNKTTRNVRNEDLINKSNGADFCSVELDIVIRGIEYKIARKSKKQYKKRTGEYHWTRTDLKLSRVLEDGSEEDLTETQRNETEKIIRNAIGSYDDFLTTTLTIQSSQHEFIFQNPAVRSENMARFLGLDIFNRKYDVSKDILREVDASRKIMNLDEKTKLLTVLDNDVKRYTDIISKKNKMLLELKDSIEYHNGVLASLRSMLNTKIDVNETRDEIEKRLNEVNGEISSFKDEIGRLELLIKKSNENIEKFESQLVDIRNEDLELLKKLPDLQEIRREVLTTIDFDTKCVNSLKKEVESDDVCPITELDLPDPPCKFIARQSESRDKIVKLENNIKELTNRLLKIDEKLSQISSINERQHINIQLHDKIKDQRESIEKFNADIDKLRSMIDVKEMTISMLNEKLEIVDKNEEIVIKNSITRKEIDKVTKKIKMLQNKRESLHRETIKYSNNLAVSKSRLSEIKKIIDEINTNNNEYELYNWYTKAMHRTGIPITVLKKYIPVINYDLNRILTPIVGYGVYFKIDDDSDNIEIVMRYDDTIDDTRPITMASGMEKFIANMAIRHVLLKISCLNKPTIRIIDEGFDVLDNDNIYLVQKFFENVKNEYDNVIIITHIDSLKDMADHIINVSQVNGISKLQMN